MKKSILLILATVLLAAIFVTSCKKSQPEAINDGHAKVILAGYSCSPSCDAIGYAIQVSNGSVYNPGTLPEDFRVNNLAIKITYTTTDKYPAPFSGPYYRLINILKIEK